MSSCTRGTVLFLLAAAVAAPACAEDARQPENGPKPTQHRFNMTQSGKKMSAEDFDAWMKSRGVRVATGNAAPAAKSEQDAGKDGNKPADSDS